MILSPADRDAAQKICEKYDVGFCMTPAGRFRMSKKFGAMQLVGHGSDLISCRNSLHDKMRIYMDGMSTIDSDMDMKLSAWFDDLSLMAVELEDFMYECRDRIK